MYVNLARKVPERNVTLPNGDKGTERKFGLSTCTSVPEKTDRTRAAESAGSRSASALRYWSCSEA